MFQQTCQGTDLAIVEGAMGLYDGDSVNHGTTAEIARLLNIPILLAVNTTRMTGSIAAMVTGYQHFQPDIKVAGVILNYVSGSRHERKLRDAVEQYCGIPVVGSIPRDQDLHMSERHLGLIPSLESGEAETLVERIGRKMESYLDLENILAIARELRNPLPFLFASWRGWDERLANLLKPRLGLSLIVPSISTTRKTSRLWAELALNSFSSIHFRTDCPGLTDFISAAGSRSSSLRSWKETVNYGRILQRPSKRVCRSTLNARASCIYAGASAGRIDPMKWLASFLLTFELSQRPEGHGYVVAEVIEENPLVPHRVDRSRS